MEIGGSKITLSQRTTPVRATDNDFSSLSSLSSSSSPSLPLRSQSSSLSSLSTLSVLSSLSSLSSSLSPSPSNLNTPNSNTPKSRETAEIEEQKATIEEKPSNLVALYLSKLQTAFHLRDMEKTKDLCEKLVTLCTDEKNMFKNSSALASSGGLGILCEILNSQSDPIRFEIVRPICFLFSTISHKSKFNRSLARVGAPRPLLHLFKLLLSSLSLSASSASSSTSSTSSSVSSLHPPRSSSRASVSSPRLNRNTNSPTPSLSNSPPQDRIQKQQNKEIEKKEVDNESSPTELDTEKEKDKDKEKEKEKENRKEIVGKERELLHHVLSTLVHLSQIDTTKLPLVMRLEGGLIPLINLLKAGIDESCTSLSLSLSPEFSPVLSLALQFLGAVVDKNGNNCTAVVKEGGVTTILGYLQKMDCYLQITEPAVVVLNRVSEKEKSILGSSGMEIVVSAARRYVTNLPVVLPILGMIYNVIAELENFVSVADLKKDDIFALCEISEKNPHELKVANIVCSILGKIIKLKQQQQTQPSQEVLDIPEDGLNVSIPHSTSPPPSSSSSSSFSNSSISSSSSSSSSASSSSSSSLPPLPSATPTQSTLFPEFLPNPSFSPLPPSVFVVRTAAKKILAESPVHLPIFPPPADSSLSPSPSEFIPISTTSSSSFSSISSPHLTSSSASSNSFSLNSSSSTSSPSLLTPSYSPPNVELFHESRSNLAIDMMMRALRIKNDFKPVEVYNSTESVCFTPVNSRTVQFESRFESGNLQKAFQIGEYEYNLTTSPDVNTQKHTQWFYFRVSNLIPRIDYKFNIVNMEKPTSEFNKGMRPLMYSDKDAKTSGIGWVRCGRDICYYPNQFVRKSDPSCTYYTLTFTVQFPHAGDTCYFAVNYPYTVAMWKSHLAYLVDGRFNDRLLYSTLCRTLAGNACDLLTITSLPYDLSLGKRKYVIFSARVHPGESGCSYMMKGIIDFLVSDSPIAKTLRNTYVFKIIPMLNMDGVAEGNHRSSLSGVDLNRQWLDPSPILHPTIFHMKEMIRSIQAQHGHEAFLFVDLHCHFRKKNIFIYGCEGASSGEEKDEEISLGSFNASNVRSFPYLLSQKAPCFSFADCSFKVQESKKGTGRIVVWREMHINFSFTMEASFCGMSIGPYKDQHLNIHHLENMGKHLCQTLADISQMETTSFGNAANSGDQTLPKSESTKTGSIPALPSVGTRKRSPKPRSNSKSNITIASPVVAKAKPKAKPKKP